MFCCVLFFVGVAVVVIVVVALLLFSILLRLLNSNNVKLRSRFKLIHVVPFCAGYTTMLEEIVCKPLKFSVQTIPKHLHVEARRTPTSKP